MQQTCRVNKVWWFEHVNYAGEEQEAGQIILEIALTNPL